MRHKSVFINGVGDVTIYKLRRNKSIRLSIDRNGGIRVSIPMWSPFKVGALFALNHKDWITNQRAKHTVHLIENGAKIGIGQNVNYIYERSKGPTIRIKHTAEGFTATSGLPIDDPRTQKRLQDAVDKSLKLQAENLLPDRLRGLSQQYGFTYRQVAIRKLVSRWGSCSSKGDILLSSYLMQLPWRLIDYVLVHELVHTKHKNHGPNFWSALENIMPDAKIRRKELKNYKTRFKPGED